MISQINARGWITIYISEPGEQGEPGQKGDDAEFYDFAPLTEKCFVYINSTYPNGCLAVQLQYNILHVKGTTTEAVTASSSGYHIRFRTNISATYYYLSYNTKNPNYTNATFLNNYHNATNKPEWLIVELCNGSSHTVLKQKIVGVIFNTDLIFDINTELNQISSTVQGHTTAIGNLENREFGNRNYVRNSSDEWSDWITLRNINNQTIQFGDCYLPAEKSVGEYFTSQITIEFSSVEASNDGTFRISAQASMDGSWTIPRLFDNELINLTTEPEDNVVKYTHTYQIQESNKDTILMRPMIRVDYALGAIRYKCLQVEKGNTATDWNPNPDDFNGQITTITNNISTINQTMEQISSTVSSHTTSINNLNNDITEQQTNISNLTQRADSIESTVSSHTTSINTNTTNISNLTQRADSIESTVKSLRTGTTNYFHFTGTLWQNAIPYIQEYGFEGTNGASVNRISNLGFNGESGDFVVSCEMRMQTSGASIVVDLCDKAAEDGEGSFGLGTTWTKKTFLFKNVVNYISPSSYNGFIDFQGGFNNTNRLYVRRLIITRGQVAQEFTPSVFDTENHDSNNIVDFDTNLVSVEDKDYKGYDVYTPTSYNTSGTDTTDYLFKNNVSLKTNTVYTLSFWAKSQSPVVIASYFYGNDGSIDGTILPDINSITRAGEITNGNAQDGVTYSYLGSAYKHYIIHWYNKNSGNRNILVMRTGHDWWRGTEQPNINITGIEFREGYWVEDELNTQSMIRQTASEIELKVNSTGINIEDGTITLNSDKTNFIGNINIYDASQGIIIYDNNKNPKITVQNDSIGTLDNFNLGSDRFLKGTKSYTRTSAGSSLTITFSSISLGSFSVGNSISIHDVYVGGGFKYHYFNTAISSISYTYTIKRGTTTVNTTTGTATPGNGTRPMDLKLKDYNNANISTAGTYSFNLSVTFNLIGDSVNYVEQFSSFVYLYLKKTETSINKIATDGGVFASSATQYNWFGSDKTQLRNGISALRLENGRILRNGYNEADRDNNTMSNIYSDISSTVPYQIINALTYTATIYDALICFSTVIGQTDSAQRTLYLPEPGSCPGKIYYVKNFGGTNTRVYTINQSSNAFTQSSSKSTTTYINVTDESYMFISCGLYWITFSCS